MLRLDYMGEEMLDGLRVYSVFLIGAGHEAYLGKIEEETRWSSGREGAVRVGWKWIRSESLPWDGCDLREPIVRARLQDVKDEIESRLYVTIVGSTQDYPIGGTKR